MNTGLLGRKKYVLAAVLVLMAFLYLTADRIFLPFGLQTSDYLGWTAFSTVVSRAMYEQEAPVITGYKIDELSPAENGFYFYHPPLVYMIMAKYLHKIRDVRDKDPRVFAFAHLLPLLGVCGAAFFIFLICRQLWDDRTGFYAFFAFLFCFPITFFATVYSPQTIPIVFLPLNIFLYLRYRLTGRSSYLALTVLFSAIGAFACWQNVLLPAFIGAAEFMDTSRTRRIARAIAWISLSPIVFLFIVGRWLVQYPELMNRLRELLVHRSGWSAGSSNVLQPFLILATDALSSWHPFILLVALYLLFSLCADDLRFKGDPKKFLKSFVLVTTFGVWAVYSLVLMPRIAADEPLYNNFWLAPCIAFAFAVGLRRLEGKINFKIAAPFLVFAAAQLFSFVPDANTNQWIYRRPHWSKTAFFAGPDSSGFTGFGLPSVVSRIENSKIVKPDNLMRFLQDNTGDGDVVIEEMSRGYNILAYNVPKRAFFAAMWLSSNEFSGLSISKLMKKLKVSRSVYYVASAEDERNIFGAKKIEEAGFRTDLAYQDPNWKVYRIIRP